MSEQTSFPLSWPDNWPRNKYRYNSPFTRPTSFAARRRSMEECRRELAAELRRLGATKEVLSTNVRLRLDGSPYSGQAQPTDPGAAVYFQLKGKPVSLACDKWNRVEDNIWAIVKHIESIRGQERWGVGSVEQAFRGYMALPTPGQSSGIQWWSVLGVPINASADQVKDAYRILVAKHHPDKGGDVEMFHRVQEAFRQFESVTKHAA
jgi:DnaJ domain